MRLILETWRYVSIHSLWWKTWPGPMSQSATVELPGVRLGGRSMTGCKSPIFSLAYSWCWKTQVSGSTVDGMPSPASPHSQSCETQQASAPTLDISLTGAEAVPPSSKRCCWVWRLRAHAEIFLFAAGAASQPWGSYERAAYYLCPWSLSGLCANHTIPHRCGWLEEAAAGLWKWAESPPWSTCCSHEHMISAWNSLGLGPMYVVRQD